MSDKVKILQVNSSVMGEASQSNRLSTRIIDQLAGQGLVDQVVLRDLNNSLPLITQEWVVANNSPEEDRTAAQQEVLALSDQLIAEIEEADILVIGVALYNFAVSASLKAWIDLICRARKTFVYSEDGPKGLLKGKKAIVTFASGGTPFGSDIDFASDFLRHILGFIGIDDVEFVAADQHFMAENALENADRSADDLVARISASEKAA